MRAARGLAAGLLALAAAAPGCAPVYSESASPGALAATHADPGPDREPDPERATDPPPAADAPAANRAALVRALESLVWPLAADGSRLLSSVYGDRIHPASGDSRFHGGLDLRAREGTPVYAAADGVVAVSGTSGAYGNVVMVDHGGGLRTLYAHHERNLVRAGDPVRRGQPIALVGHTGNATGDHLHFEVRWKDGTVDPRLLLPRLSAGAAR